MDPFKPMLVKYTQIAQCRQQVSVCKQFFTSTFLLVHHLQYIYKITPIKYMRAKTICHITPAKGKFKKKKEKKEELPENRAMFLNVGS